MMVLAVSPWSIGCETKNKSVARQWGSSKGVLSLKVARFRQVLSEAVVRLKLSPWLSSGEIEAESVAKQQ